VNCTICEKPIVLVPSAAERAKKYGQPAAYYTALFTTHDTCALAKRAADTAELCARLTAEAERRVVRL
jgi:hypothetical protein